MEFLKSFYFWASLGLVVVGWLGHILGAWKLVWKVLPWRRFRVDIEVMRDSYFMQKAFIDEKPPSTGIPTAFRIRLRLFYASERPTGVRDIYIEEVDGATFECFNPYIGGKNTHLIGDGQEVAFTRSSGGEAQFLGSGFNPDRDSLVLKDGEPILVTLILEGFLTDYREKVRVQLVIVDSKNRKKRFTCEGLRSRAP
jgi:hypothetical protein